MLIRNATPQSQLHIISYLGISFSTPDTITTLEKSNILLEEQVDAVIARLGDNWKTLASELSLTEDEITIIQTENLEVKEQSKAMITAWMNREGDQATRDVLTKALMESGLNDIVESVLSDN